MKKALVVAACIGLPMAAWAAPAPSTSDLEADPGTPGDIVTYGGYDLQRHSSLTQINRQTVRRLVPVWNLSLSNNFPQETQPLLVDGVMYATTTDATVAIDAISGKQIWRAPVTLPQDVYAVTCCGSHNRGAAAYQGMLFRGTLDAHVIALDMKTGRQLWRAEVADYKQGYSVTGAPLVANGVVITGMSGGEYGTRGFLDGWDPKTGKRLWRRYTTAGPDEAGGDTWYQETYLHGGGPTWLTGSYDPELDLVYWGVGNGGPWNPSARNPDGKPRDNLYIGSVIAMRPRTGEIVWHYQFSPNDPYDYDGVNELVLAELNIEGAPRKVVMQANRNGFFYVLDRKTGRLLAANPFVDRINWAKGIDLKTGRPIDSEVTTLIRGSLEMKTAVEISPSCLGGKNWSPMSYSQKEGLVFANTLDISFPYRTEAPKLKPGSFYLGMDLTVFHLPENKNGGYLKAIDPLTGVSKWQVPLGVPNLGGVLSSDGGLVFTGAMTGEFMAYDSSNGRKLWQFQAGSGVIGIPVTWERGGRQYVTVASGIGGVYALYGADERLNNVPAGGSLWTFALYEEPAAPAEEKAGAAASLDGARAGNP